MQSLDTAKANITAVSLNFCLIKLVKEQSKFFAIINLQFVESVAVLIINIHRSGVQWNKMSSLLVFFYVKNTNEDEIF